MKLTSQEKQAKAQKQAVNTICNKLVSYFSLKQITTWKDVYETVGYPNEWINQQIIINDKVTIDDIHKFCDKLRSDLNKQLGEVSNVSEAKGTHEVGDSAEQINSNIQSQPEINNTPITQSVSDVVSQAITDTESLRPDIQFIGKVEEIEYTEENNYGLIPSPKENVNLYYFQKKATAQLLHKIVQLKMRAVLLIAAAGSGKTFIEFALDRRLKDMQFEKGKTWGHMPYLAITRNSVVEQTKRVAQNKFSINPISETEVINIEKLRVRAGQIWIEEKQEIKEGEEVTTWHWKKLINPCVIYLDECQAVKNQDSTQHKIMMAYTDIPDNTTQVYISATPFNRVSDAKAFACATRKDISKVIGIPGAILTESTWPTYAKMICGEGVDPTDYNEAAVDRLMDDLDDYIVRVKGVRWQFNAKNSVRVVKFPEPNEKCNPRKEYNDAWIKYLERKAKLNETVTDNPLFQAWIEMSMFLTAAEYSKRYVFAETMYRDVQEGYAAALAVKNKKTIIAVVKILMEDYGVPRDKISLIWGGGQTQLTAKQKLKAQIKANMNLFEQAGVTMKDMLLDDVEDREMEDIPKEYRLGNQSKEERQKEIDKYQRGDSLYCIYTYKAGGVGLSIHHTDEQTTRWNERMEGFAEWKAMIDKWNASHKNPKDKVLPGKIRRKESGYAYEEDIKYVTTRPRKVTIGPVWSAIDMVQGCARAPRLTSLSDTVQEFIYFADTVEEEQAAVVMHRLKCLHKVVRQKENWYELIEKYDHAKEIAAELINKGLKDEVDGPVTDIDEGNEEEEE